MVDSLPLIVADKAARRALGDARLRPPGRPGSLADGPTAALRDAMARFSGPVEHPPRRAALERLLQTIDLHEAGELAESIAAELLEDPAVDAAALSWAVPTHVVAVVLGLGNRREQVRAATESLARVIGRNEPSSEESDRAVALLLAWCADHPDPVAAVSILYQNHDATAALIRSAAARDDGEPVPPSGTSTRRVATASLGLDGRQLSPGDDVVIQLDGLPYGSGPHQCPGRALAEAIARGVVRAIRS